MHVFSLISLLAVLSSTVLATPAGTIPGTRVRSVSGSEPELLPRDADDKLIIKTFSGSELKTDPNLIIGDKHKLQKREHQDCWDNHLSTSFAEAYEHDCERLIETMARNPRSQLLHAGQSVVFHTHDKRCKIVVRNQSTCHLKTPFIITIGIAARDTLTTCASLTELSGWGYVTTTDHDLVYIIEPYEIAPPRYSPSCA
jgi:hypothetical protein